MESDRALFLNTDENPAARSAVYTPPGGVAQPAITGLYVNQPLYAEDGYNGEDVIQAETWFMAKSSDVSDWVLNGRLAVSGKTYIVANAPIPDENDNLWSMIPLELPRGEETLI